jgi:hypothetical protein
MPFLRLKESGEMSDVEEEKYYAMNWTCSNCGRSGVEKLRFGEPSDGMRLCDYCGCNRKRFVKSFLDDGLTK